MEQSTSASNHQSDSKSEAVSDFGKLHVANKRLLFSRAASSSNRSSTIDDFASFDDNEEEETKEKDRLEIEEFHRRNSQTKPLSLQELDLLHRSTGIWTSSYDGEEYGDIPTQAEIRSRRSPWTRLFLYISGLPPKDLRKKYMVTENLTDQDIENRFTSLSLAFKTDKLTLDNRLELQQRHRDIAERNIDKEIQDLKMAIGSLNRICSDADTRDLLNRLQQRVDVLRQSSKRVSSAAEIYGAVQQEARISRAIEIMLLHVDNLKRLYEKEHTELEEAKRFLASHNLSVDQQHQRRASEMATSVSSGANPEGRVRSISLIVNPPTSGLMCPSSTKPRRISLQAEAASHPARSISVEAGKNPIKQPVRKISVYGPSGRIRKVSQGNGNANSSICPIVERNEDGNKENKGAEENNNLVENVEMLTEESKADRPRIRSKSTTHQPCFEDLDEVNEEEEEELLEELDTLELERDQLSHIPVIIKEQVQAIRRGSLLRTAFEWYNDLSWPWDFEETVMGIRYLVTGALLFLAFMTLVWTFVGKSVEEEL